uniref:BHLH domain-containing protein n=1 Tax=Kalanchoe fedtschenkoi TaxID=63787 RepID=A0A7N0UL04_KALFE
MMPSSPEDPSWVFDYALIDDLGLPDADVASLHQGFNWSSSAQGFGCPPDLSVVADHSSVVPDEIKDDASRKRVRSACATSGSKACKEKMRRDKLNDRFMELGHVLDPGRPPKSDKALILNDAVRLLTQLRDETLKLKESNENLHHKITELKAEKNELRDEKQRLKMEKEKLEMQVNVFTMQPSFLPRPSAIPAPFAAQGQVTSGKFLPYVSYPAMPMWQFMPPTTVDTSQDHVLRPPVA